MTARGDHHDHRHALEYDQQAFPTGGGRRRHHRALLQLFELDDAAAERADRGRSERDFSLEAGTAAGVQAFGYASATIGQPFNSTIYFSVDCDLFRNSELAAVDSFFTGVRDAFAAAANGGASYAVGVYGSGTVLDHLRVKGLATFFWLAQSQGWSGYKDFKNSNRWHLLQGAATTVAGLDVDTNDDNPTRPDFGAFLLNAGADA